MKLTDCLKDLVNSGVSGTLKVFTWKYMEYEKREKSNGYSFCFSILHTE